MNKLYIYVILFLIVIGGIFVFVSQKQNSTPAQTGTSVSPSVQAGYTLADVKNHKDASSCWTAINGKVYDVTSFINRHEGGADKILSLCGIDGSSAFNGQHSGQPRPATELSQFYIGDLK